MPLDRVLDLAWDISSDGNVVLYAHRETSVRAQGLYLLDLRSPSVHRFIAPYGPVAGGIIAARLSPGGTRLAVIRAGAAEVSVLDLESETDSLVTAAQGNISRPDWSPLEDTLVYARPFLAPGAADTTAGLYVVPLAGPGEHALLVEGRATYGAGPRWSPAGGAIAYTYGIPLHLHVVAADGSELRDVTPGSSWEFDDPFWAGPSRLVAEAISPQDGSRRTVLVDVATGAITTSPVDLRPYDLISTLTPDGKTFVFSAPDPGMTCYVLYKQEFADASGGSRVQITPVEPLPAGTSPAFQGGGYGRTASLYP